VDPKKGALCPKKGILWGPRAGQKNAPNGVRPQFWNLGPKKIPKGFGFPKGKVWGPPFKLGNMCEIALYRVFYSLIKDFFGFVCGLTSFWLVDPLLGVF